MRNKISNLDIVWSFWVKNLGEVNFSLFDWSLIKFENFILVHSLSKSKFHKRLSFGLTKSFTFSPSSKIRSLSLITCTFSSRISLSTIALTSHGTSYANSISSSRIDSVPGYDFILISTIKLPPISERSFGLILLMNNFGRSSFLILERRHTLSSFFLNILLNFKRNISKMIDFILNDTILHKLLSYYLILFNLMIYIDKINNSR